jgi:ABC-type glycerol-3-phosphate transport system substrate-binding protein
MRGKPRRALVLAGLLSLALAAAVGATAGRQSAPVGHFPGVSLTLSRWAGDPWETETKNAAAQWATATGGQISVDAVPYESRSVRTSWTNR